MSEGLPQICRALIEQIHQVIGRSFHGLQFAHRMDPTLPYLRHLTGKSRDPMHFGWREIHRIGDDRFGQRFGQKMDCVGHPLEG